MKINCNLCVGLFLYSYLISAIIFLGILIRLIPFFPAWLICISLIIIGIIGIILGSIWAYYSLDWSNEFVLIDKSSIPLIISFCCIMFVILMTFNCDFVINYYYNVLINNSSQLEIIIQDFTNLTFSKA